MHDLLRRCMVLVFAVLTIAFVGPLSAQVPQPFSAAAEASSADDPETRLDALIKAASEAGVRVVVIEGDDDVEAQGANAATPIEDVESALMSAQDRAVRFRQSLIERLLNLPDNINEVIYILRAASPDGTIMAFFRALIYSLGFFAIGMLAEARIYGPRIAKRFVVSRIVQEPQGYSDKMPFLFFRFLMGVIGTLFSMLVAYVLGYLIFGPLEDTAMQFTVALINVGYFSCRFVIGIWRMILSPFLTQYRIPAFSDRDARKLFRWLSIVTTAGFAAALLGIWIRELGLNYEVFALLSSLNALLVVLLNMVMALANRGAISNAIRNGKSLSVTTWPLRILSTFWVPLLFVYLMFAWITEVIGLVLGEVDSIPLIAASYGILTVILVVYGGINFLIERGFSRARAMRKINAVTDPEDQETAPAGEGVQGEWTDVQPAPRTGLRSFEDLAQRVAGILAFVAGAYAFVLIWAPGAAAMSDSLPDRFLDVIFVLFLGYIAYNAFRIWIDRKIEDEMSDVPEAELGDEGGGTSASRLATLLPLFRSVMLIVIMISIAFIALMELGVNVGPLFAGAGIVGVAIGFGSQSLVRDIFSGAFFLFDDAFRKGEYIDIGGVKGTVEKISVRSFQLRHHLGALHTIPFGEIQVMTNYSRDWVMMKLPLRVTYDTDVDKVRKLIKKLGQDLLEDPEIGPDFIQPLKSQGVIEMQDSAMIIRVKFMTKPGDQWVIRKRVYQEIRELFEREGIKFAHREVTVRLADDAPADLTPQQREALTAAAEAALEDDLLEGGADERDDDR